MKKRVYTIKGKIPVIADDKNEITKNEIDVDSLGSSENQDSETIYYKFKDPKNFGGTYVVTMLSQALMLSPDGKVVYVSGSNAFALFQQMLDDTTIYAGLMIPPILYIEGMEITKISSLENYLKEFGLEDIISMIERITKEEFDNLVNQYIPKIDKVI